MKQFVVWEYCVTAGLFNDTEQLFGSVFEPELRGSWIAATETSRYVSVLYNMNKQNVYIHSQTAIRTI
jgi:hypothetical protein